MRQVINQLSSALQHIYHSSFPISRSVWLYGLVSILPATRKSFVWSPAYENTVDATSRRNKPVGVFPSFPVAQSFNLLYKFTVKIVQPRTIYQYTCKKKFYMNHRSELLTLLGLRIFWAFFQRLVPHYRVNGPNWTGLWSFWNSSVSKALHLSKLYGSKSELSITH